jgi:HEAT repeat protein
MNRRPRRIPNILLGLALSLLTAGCLWGCGLGEDEVQRNIRRLKDRNPVTRSGSAINLGDLKDPRAVEPLIAALQDRESSVQGDAAQALGRLQDPRAVEPLIALLQDPKESVRENAVKALGSLEDPRAMRPLISLLSRYILSPSMEEAVRAALMRIDPRRFLENIISALGDSDPKVRAAAASLLGQFRDPRALEPLVAALGDRDEQVRCAAARALGKMQDSRALEPLLKALRDNNCRLRECAVDSLENLKDPRAVGPLLEALLEKDRNCGISHKIARCLKELKSPEAVEYLARAFRSSDASVRYRAIQVLKELEGPQVALVMEAALKDNDPRVRREASSYLKWKNNHPQRMGLLIQALKDPDALVRIYAIQGLSQLKDPRAMPDLIPLLADTREHQGNQPVSKFAEDALQSFGPAAAGPLLENLNGPGALRVAPCAVIATLAGINDPRVDAFFQEILQKVKSANNFAPQFDFSCGYKYFIRKGVAEAEPALIALLQNYKGGEGGNMAYVFLNCGNPRLRQAAEQWARTHGYNIKTMPAFALPSPSIGEVWGRK